MRRPRYETFKCTLCGNREERFVETNEDGTVIEVQTCTNELWGEGAAPPALGCCGGSMKQLDVGDGSGQACLPAPINKRNSDFKDRERERLEKRRDEHFKKKGRDEKMDRINTMKRQGKW